MTATLVAAADRQARGLVPALRAIQAEGILSIGAITRAFNGRLLRAFTYRGNFRYFAGSGLALSLGSALLDFLKLQLELVEQKLLSVSLPIEKVDRGLFALLARHEAI